MYRGGGGGDEAAPLIISLLHIESEEKKSELLDALHTHPPTHNIYILPKK